MFGQNSVRKCAAGLEVWGGGGRSAMLSAMTYVQNLLKRQNMKLCNYSDLIRLSAIFEKEAAGLVRTAVFSAPLQVDSNTVQRLFWF